MWHCLWMLWKLFTYFLWSLLVSVDELQKVILRTGFEVSTLSTADFSVTPERKSSTKGIHPTQFSLSIKRFKIYEKLFDRSHIHKACIAYYLLLLVWPISNVTCVMIPSVHYMTFFHLVKVHFGHQVTLVIRRERKTPHLNPIQVGYTACGISVFDSHYEQLRAVCLSH